MSAERANILTRMSALPGHTNTPAIHDFGRTPGAALERAMPTRTVSPEERLEEVLP